MIRFSALGDILMTVPIVEALAHQHPDMQITMVSRPFVGSIFAQLPANVHFVGINPRNYPGIKGLYRLYRELKALHPTCVCDLHDVLRTKVLRTFFRLSGTPVSHIVKNRRARKQFLSAPVKTQQETSFERYSKAINQLVDFSVPSAAFSSGEGLCAGQCEKLSKGSTNGQASSSIGIAPFAAHQGKIYPLDMMEKVVELLSQRGQKVYLFGAGDKEKEILEAWEKRYEGVESMVGKLSNMAAELELMKTLRCMLTMDSGNMHLASVGGVRVISIWGATHPLGGFLGWGQSMDDVIQLDLPCRPCSIFGNKPCKFGDYRCLTRITPQQIVDKLMNT